MEKRNSQTHTEAAKPASPQLENGYTRIANEIMEALANKEITGRMASYSFHILLAVIRKTYGYQKKVDWISNSQLAQMTGIGKQHVSRTMKELCDRRFLLRSGKKVGLNKNYHEWVKALKGEKLPNEVTISQPDNQGKLPVEATKVTSLGDKSNLIVEPQKNKKEIYGDSPKDGEPLQVQNPESQNPPTEGKALTPEKQDLTKPKKVRKTRKPRKAGTGKPKKVTDPRIAEAIAYFSETCQELKGFKPAITGGKDGGNVKKALETMDLSEIKACIRFFLNSPKSKELGVSLSTALTSHTVNQYREFEAKGSSEVPAYKRQYA